MGRNLHDSSLAGTITAKAGVDATNDDKGELTLRRAETPRPPLQHLRSLGRTLLTHVAHQISNISPSSALHCQTFFPPAYSVNSIESHLRTLRRCYHYTAQVLQRYTLGSDSTSIAATAKLTTRIAATARSTISGDHRFGMQPSQCFLCWCALIRHMACAVRSWGDGF